MIRKRKGVSGTEVTKGDIEKNRGRHAGKIVELNAEHGEDRDMWEQAKMDSQARLFEVMAAATHSPAKHTAATIAIPLPALLDSPPIGWYVLMLIIDPST